MSKTPKLRFKEFSGEWKTDTLGDRAYIKGRIGWKNLKQEEYTVEGPYNCWKTYKEWYYRLG